VALSWTAPSSDGGSAITGYDIYEGTSSGGESTTPVNSSAITGTSYTATGLTNGTTYYFTVVAVNDVGSSNASSEAAAIPATVPGTPTGLTATAGNGQVALSWTAPSSDGGSAITGYDIYEGTSSGGESSTPVNSSAITGTSYTVTGLTDGTTYYFTVVAINNVGTSTPASEVSSTPAGAPSAPTGLTATPGNGQVVLSWTAPSSDGGGVIEGYDIYEGTSSGGESTTPINPTPITSTAYTVTGLTDGTTYYFTVVAIGETGTSPAAAEVSALPTPTPTHTPTSGYREVASDGGVFDFGNAQFHGSMGGKSLNAPVVGTAEVPGGGGYWEVASDGGIFSFGDAQFYGSMGGKPLNKPIVGMVATPDGKGYWLVASDGGIFSFGDAQFYGSMGGKPLNKPIVGMVATPDGKGYWLVASDGGIFSFGDAQFYGSVGGKPLNKPIVGMVATPDGKGYWMVASDGGIFTFGDAKFYGSMGGKPLNAPVVGLVATTAP